MAAPRLPALTCPDQEENRQNTGRVLGPVAWRRDQRARVWVAQLDQRGLFATRNAAEHAGRALGVSHATVHTLLKETRRARDAAQRPA
jgi:predicted transcriptional regulator YheO